jgi:hypothetical protein
MREGFANEVRPNLFVIPVLYEHRSGDNVLNALVSVAIEHGVIANPNFQHDPICQQSFENKVAEMNCGILDLLVAIEITN